MRIQIADSTGRPEPQFVVFAENECDRHILKMFCKAKEISKVPLKLWLHGSSMSSDVQGITSFNFGWVEDTKG